MKRTLTCLGFDAALVDGLEAAAAEPLAAEAAAIAAVPAAELVDDIAAQPLIEEGPSFGA